ncbi:MAG: hypothetical protein EAZ57_03535 [Cytophagales bacterium]|nr:MAG: hypothetical protein EAZ67_04000 [Cytophagales bacterium]TAF61535.1 MAG: hypothetical protein EAZ57_03535 [Cytophagales bacterium]
MLKFKNILPSAIAIVFSLESCAVKTSPEDNQSTKTVTKAESATSFQELIQGKWIHTDDPDAVVEIVGDQWAFCHKGVEVSESDKYKMTFTDKLTDLPSGESQDNTSYLVLSGSNNEDELQYQILDITKDSLNLMYLPAGKIHQYKR